MFRSFSLNISGALHEYTRPQVMGIINVTPDSFFGSSRAQCAYEIEKKASEMLMNGVDFFDIGGYSTRPGAGDVSEDEELRRLDLGLRCVRKVSDSIPISVDTFRASVARRSVTEYGADMINDVSGGTLDEKMFTTVAELKVPYVLMHMRGKPDNMSTLTDYTNVTAEVIKDLSVKLRALRLLGVADVILDPGFGFSKTTEQNFELLRHLESFGRMFREPLLVGFSRKSMISKTLYCTPEEALNGTTVLNTIALSRGAAFLRVHDVREAAEAVKLYSLSTL